MNITIIGGGAWGTTLAQVLTDNGHQPLIYDINQTTIDVINTHRHPFYDCQIPTNIKATNHLDEALAFADWLVLSMPSKAVRDALSAIKPHLFRPVVIINVAKGIEPDTSKRISEISKEVIPPEFLKGYVVLTGPSHAEEVILRRPTLLVSASEDEALAKQVRQVFNNEDYLRIYTSTDVIGCELGGAVKNAIAVISGACTGLNLGENARAAVITRGIVEIVRVVEAMGGRKETAFGLTGIGDLIVTASSEHSRNFRAGKKIGQGMTVAQIYAEEKQTIEGIRTIEAMHHLAAQKGIELPLIEAAYGILQGRVSASEATSHLLKRTLKSEDF